MLFTGKKAIITGGSSGIGLEAARLLVEKGGDVAILGRDEQKLEAAKTLLGPNALAVPADVARPNDIARAMSRIGLRFGKIDILFANAGISDAPDIADMIEADFDKLVGINVKGVVFSVVHALPILNDGASIILNGSVAARKGRPGDPLYAASKGAVRSFGRTLAADSSILARRIRVNVVTPGPIRTPLTQAAIDDSAIEQHVASLVPMGRWGEAKEVAQAVLFLASAASSYITGAEITVDGGLSHV